MINTLAYILCHTSTLLLKKIAHGAQFIMMHVFSFISQMIVMNLLSSHPSLYGMEDIETVILSNDWYESHLPWTYLKIECKSNTCIIQHWDKPIGNISLWCHVLDIKYHNRPRGYFGVFGVTFSTILYLECELRMSKLWYYFVRLLKNDVTVLRGSAEKFIAWKGKCWN